MISIRKDDDEISPHDAVLLEEQKLRDALPLVREAGRTFDTLRVMRIENNWAAKARRALGAT